MAAKNSPAHNTSIDLEREAIKRFRELVRFSSPKCRVWRELKGRETLLCLDFADCPQALKMNQSEWEEVMILLAISCDDLGIAKYVVFKNGERIVVRMSLGQRSSPEVMRGRKKKGVSGN